VRCVECHGVYQDPFLLPVGNPYDEHTAAEYFVVHEISGAIANGRRLARRATELVGRPGRMLELGCGRGALLRGAAEEGWKVRGVEMTSAFAAEGSGLDIEVAAVENARSLDEKYDAIVLAAILEHLYEPAECLERIRAALTPGGVVFIDVPNECSLWSRAANLYMRARARPWAVNLSPTFSPFHVVGFCPRSLRTLLQRTGFDIEELTLWAYPNCLPAATGLRATIERQASATVQRIGGWVGMGAGINCWARARA
jgi:2-polyprenyl-3-methyl-5-hydroxy-6-metoxy-1,4-benzoquinol methylase